jgi:hypothetical protein
MFVRINADGLITEERRYFDMDGIMGALGLLQSPSVRRVTAPHAAYTVLIFSEDGAPRALTRAGERC